MAAKKQKPKTFKDSKGNIRQTGGSGKIVKRAAVNPLDAAVNSAIGAQVQPYTAMDKSRLAQYNKDAADTSAVQETLQQRLAGIQSGLQSANADALGLAAQRGTASADQMQRNMDFLKQTLGNYTSDAGAIVNGVQPAVVASGADAAGNAAGVGFAGSASANQLAAQRGASVLAGGERSAQLLNARKQDQLAIQREIARIRSQAPLLKRQFGRENAELSMVRQELGLKKQTFAEQQRQFDLSQTEASRQFDESLGADRASQAEKDAAAKNKNLVKKWGVSVPKHLVSDLDGLYSASLAPKTPEGAENPAHRWRTVYAEMTKLGIGKAQAALLASTWLPDRLKIHGKKSPQVIYKMFKDGSLGFKASDGYLKALFSKVGLDWSKRVAKSPSVKLPGVTGTGPNGTVGTGDIGGGGMVGTGDLAGGVNLS